VNDAEFFSNFWQGEKKNLPCFAALFLEQKTVQSGSTTEILLFNLVIGTPMFSTPETSYVMFCNCYCHRRLQLKQYVAYVGKFIGRRSFATLRLKRDVSLQKINPHRF
jgi:hypothetical protein